NSNGSPKSIREVYAWAVGQQDAPPASSPVSVAAATAVPTKPAASNAQPIDIATLFPSMATPERIEVTAVQQNEDTPPLRREILPSAGDAMIATVQPHVLPQPPVTLNLGMVQVLASLGAPPRKAA